MTTFPLNPRKHNAMDRHSLLAAALTALLATAGCTSPAPSADSTRPDPEHSARLSLDWAGAYRGVLPCADCEGIETVVVLAPDGTYRSHARYLGKSDKVFSEHGRFRWNEAGNTVTLPGREPTRYFVGENHLRRLAPDGSRIPGALAERQVLSRLAGGPAGKYWKLVELNGRPIPKLDREPHLILDAGAGRAHGFGGCNGFSGSYQLDEARSRIRFERIASTMMSCTPGMEVEGAFHEALRTADNYSLNGDHLTLNRARMAPLARFEAVYLY